jgi:hypothetical protein
MKVFDFTNGKQGDQVGEIKRPDAFGGWFVKKGDKSFKVELTKPPQSREPVLNGEHGVRWSWNADAAHTAANGDMVPITPDQFGVEAICFCSGAWGNHSVGDVWAYWEWFVVGSNEWNRNACKAGILTATAQGAAS